jgi:serine/threonine-protein kinase RsbW
MIQVKAAGRRAAGQAIPSGPAAGSQIATMTYPGIPASVTAGRHLVRAVLAACPRADGAELIAAELMTNAIRHTASGRAGGIFTLTIRHRPGWARIEVGDLGGDWPPSADSSGRAGRADAGPPGLAETGRGLAIVSMLADDCGREAAAARVPTCWAVLAW